MIKWRNKFSASWRLALAGALVCTGLGLVLLRLSFTLVNLGYDWAFSAWITPATPKDAIIIYMDDDSFKALNQVSRSSWDRDLHADLVRRLTADQARVVVFDILFDATGSERATTNLARAIRENGRVVLAAHQMEDQRRQAALVSVTRPMDLLVDAAAGWGVAGVYRPKGENDIARKYFVGNEFVPSMVWEAARVAGSPVTKRPGAVQPDRRLNYYGGPLTLPSISYHKVASEAPGYFRDKCVFIGAFQKTLNPLELPDVFRTPDGKEMPGVEVCATAFLNLLREDGMRELSDRVQHLMVAVVGVLFGFGLCFLKPWPALGAALAGMTVITLGALFLAARHLWFAWPILAFVQIPVALVWALGGIYIRLKFEKDVVTRTLEETTRLVESTKLTAQRPAQLVPDHDLLRLVGKGAYGEVWLARNVVGVLHAVKIVRRASFPSDVPYEREFRGIQKFMPVSRSHQGLVHVLHVGRNDTDRCFYCIMEAGDDQTTGQKIDPESYLPKSLASELKWRGRISPEETLRLGLALTESLEHLHQHHLIHRDIKPGNIIYVNGHPKFADIGLVTDMADEGKNVSFLGTQGYIPPEGPGSPGADVYALGKVLYEAAMGRDREFFPEVPTAVYEEAEDSLWRRLQAVIFRACESNASERYRSAAEMHSALKDLERGLNQRATRVE